MQTFHVYIFFSFVRLNYFENVKMILQSSNIHHGSADADLAWACM